ncbi:MAG: hypothetical protein ACLSAZ_23245 [Blautia wexlerae]
MINHFKAEFYKLRHSKILITILGVCAAVIMVSFALGDMTFFGAGDGTESVIGFQAKCYLSSEIPTFQTVARSSLAYTAFFWIIGILFATIFLQKNIIRVQSNYLLHTALNELFSTTPKRLQYWWCL